MATIHAIKEIAHNALWLSIYWQIWRIERPKEELSRKRRKRKNKGQREREREGERRNEALIRFVTLTR